MDSALWLLDPRLHHLNHGAFGAVPVPVLEAQLAWRRRFERDPVGFVESALLPGVEAARQAWAGVLGVDPDAVALLRNTTTGIGTVLAAVAPTLPRGSEILITDHTYTAARLAVETAAASYGLRVVTAHLPFPLSGPDEPADAILAAVTPRTGLLVVDLVTSPTALRLPVERLVAALEPRVPVLVDAAHGPGLVPLHVAALAPSYLVGNGHKWLCAPRGSAVLVVREDRRAGVRPLVVSHGWDEAFAPDRSRYHAMFDWTGTDDPTPWLCVPDAISTVAAMHRDGLAGVMAANRELALQARDLVCDALGIGPPAPADMLAGMVAVPLPGEPTAMLDPLAATLRDHGFVVGAFGRPVRVLRLSAHRYNEPDEYADLAALLPRLV